jgi:hypothetical protein
MTACAYYEPTPPEMNDPGGVRQIPHDAAEGLHFLIPLAGGAAARVAVCEEHGDLLTAQFAETAPDIAAAQGIEVEDDGDG